MKYQIKSRLDNFSDGGFWQDEEVREFSSDEEASEYCSELESQSPSYKYTYEKIGESFRNRSIAKRILERFRSIELYENNIELYYRNTFNEFMDLFDGWTLTGFEEIVQSLGGCGNPVCDLFIEIDNNTEKFVSMAMSDNQSDTFKKLLSYIEHHSNVSV